MAYGQRDGKGFVPERLEAAGETLARIDPSWQCFECIVNEYVGALIDGDRCREALAFLEARTDELERTARPRSPVGAPRAFAARASPRSARCSTGSRRPVSWPERGRATEGPRAATPTSSTTASSTASAARPARPPEEGLHARLVHDLEHPEVLSRGGQGLRPPGGRRRHAEHLGAGPPAAAHGAPARGQRRAPPGHQGRIHAELALDRDSPEVGRAEPGPDRAPAARLRAPHEDAPLRHPAPARPGAHRPARAGRSERPARARREGRAPAGTPSRICPASRPCSRSPPTATAR